MEKEDCIADEILMIEDGGEMPEVAFNSSLYFLTKDPDGPGLRMSAEDVRPLKQALVKRFEVIILRDLQPENRTKSIYRGVARSGANWFRLVDYCKREKVALTEIRLHVSQALGSFLTREMQDVSAGVSSCINCTRSELQDYATSLEVDLDAVAHGWQKLF